MARPWSKKAKPMPPLWAMTASWPRGRPAGSSGRALASMAGLKVGQRLAAVLAKPSQLGPMTAMSWRSATARISACMPAPASPPPSAKPLLRMMAARTPAAPQRSSSSAMCWAGMMRTARSARSGRSATEG